MENEKESGEFIPAIADTTLIAIAEQAEKQLIAMRKIKQVALAITNASDWVNENGKPYLQASGGEKIARMFGVSWEINEPKREVFNDGHYEWSYQGRFSFAGSTIMATGTRQSRDKFFSRRNQMDLPPSEVDSSDVKKSAYTNLLSNGITRLLGLRNLTWEDLNAYAKIKKEDIQGVEYKKSQKEAPGEWVETNKKPNKEDSARMKSEGTGKWRKNADGTFTWMEKQKPAPAKSPAPVEQPPISVPASDQPEIPPEGPTESDNGITGSQRKKLFAMMKEKGLSSTESKKFYDFVLENGDPTKEWASEFISNFENYFNLFTEQGK